MRKKLLILVMILILVLASSCRQQEGPDQEEPKETEHVRRSVFNGKDINENQDSYQAFGIIIENSNASRPHSGLGLADIVYENAVETYQITRFMAVFASEHPTKVGPVRSARIPFVRMAQEWGLPFAHFGSAATGQGDAKSLIESLDIPIRFDGHQAINQEFYSRDNTRKAPHNAYFNAEEALVKIPEIEYENRFEFSERTNIDQEDISMFSLAYAPDNQVGYEYDGDNKNYRRFINNEPMMDEYMEEQISVTNIIVLHAPHRTAEEARYVLVDFIGEGKAEFFIDGKYEEGTWQKDSYDEKTSFYDSEGNPIILLPGNTWIQVVHDNVEISKE